MKKKYFLILVILIFLACTWLVTSGTLLALMANGADYVLRPLIGEKNTIKLESIVFQLSDKAHQLHSQKISSAKSLLKNTSSSSPRLRTDLDLSPVANPTKLPSFEGEGIWEPILFDQFPNEEVMAQTVIHVDNDRSFAYVALVKIDTRKIKIGAVAGTRQPGGPIGNPGEGKVPDDIKQSGKLLAAFDGGFQYRDGAYGMIVDQKTYVPLRPNLATLFIDENGKPSMSTYHGEPLSPQTATVRQNGVLLVENGQITPFTEPGADNWGRTVTNSIYTWRSAVGITRDGSLLFAVGPSLRPDTLALALKTAGAVTAMQLDVNPYWVRFAIFHPAENNTYQSTPLLNDLQNGGYSYLHGYQKDFFYLYAK